VYSRPAKYVHSSRSIPRSLRVYQASQICTFFQASSKISSCISGQSNMYILPGQFQDFLVYIRPVKYVHSSRPIPRSLHVYLASQICTFFQASSKISWCISGQSNTYILPGQFHDLYVYIRPVKYVHSSRPITRFLHVRQACQIYVYIYSSVPIP
jgi:hypothetical protein